MKAILFLGLLILLVTFTTAQDPLPDKCPSISVRGPAGIVDVGELASYTVDVSNAEQYSIEYVWSVSAGRIKDGQGANTVWVVQPDSSFVVTVDVKGLPEGCTTTVSEMLACRLRAPDPIKFYALPPSKLFNKAAAANVASVMLENPNNQLYILAGDVGHKNLPAFQQKQKAIIALLLKFGITEDRITMAPVYSDVELFQFWRVPPGANNPTCEECNQLERNLKKPTP